LPLRGIKGNRLFPIKTKRRMRQDFGQEEIKGGTIQTKQKKNGLARVGFKNKNARLRGAAEHGRKVSNGFGGLAEM